MHNEAGDTSAATMLQPGQTIRPQLSQQTAIVLIESLFGLHVKTIKELNSYDDRNYFISVDNNYDNPHIADLWSHGYVFKVMNSMDSFKKHVDAESAIQRELHKAGFSCPQPVLNVRGEDDPHSQSSLHVVRLLIYQPGSLICEIAYTPDIMHQVGRYVGAVDRTLRDFSHPALTCHRSLWSLESVPSLTQFLYAVTDKSLQQLAEDVINTFTRDIIPNLDQFQRGVIHGDFNEQNIIVKQRPSATPGEDQQYDMCAVIDFGGSANSYYVFEVAITIMYMMVESSVIDPMKVGGHILAGYLSEQPLTDVEFDLLKVCVAGRYAQSLVMGAYTYTLDKGNEYLLVTAKNGWPQLRRLWNMSQTELYDQWRQTIQTYNL
ncbi:hypothetical protein NP493_652g03063 [Ridgeia piscesae]|uniref:Hydroxylysine kinase n=1 Tax=Ridgeia piscesae TaxID=27915 RepID=A0AAD9KS30_RIDPI|nr:hypothetical protein NP493_652g03063 [Ridgeia piscesae]